MLVNFLESFSLIGITTPATTANSERFSNAVNMANFIEIVGIALLGDMASETIDFKSYFCDSAGNNASALKNATQLAAHATNNDGGIVAIHVRSEDVQQATQTYTYVKFGLVTGGATGGPSGVIVLGMPRYHPGSGFDLAAVKQRKY